MLQRCPVTLCDRPRKINEKIRNGCDIRACRAILADLALLVRAKVKASQFYVAYVFATSKTDLNKGARSIALGSHGGERQVLIRRISISRYGQVAAYLMRAYGDFL